MGWMGGWVGIPQFHDHLPMVSAAPTSALDHALLVPRPYKARNLTALPSPVPSCLALSPSLLTIRTSPVPSLLTQTQHPSTHLPAHDPQSHATNQPNTLIPPSLAPYQTNPTAPSRSQPRGPPDTSTCTARPHARTRLRPSSGG